MRIPFLVSGLHALAGLLSEIFSFEGAKFLWVNTFSVFGLAVETRFSLCV